MFINDNNYKIETCDVCEEQIPIDVETGEVAIDYSTKCMCTDCPYGIFSREGGDPIPLKFD